MKLDLSKYVPLGIDSKRALNRSAVFLGVSAVYSMGFAFSYLNARNSLYMVEHRVRVLIPGAMMPDFASILGGYLMGFAVTAIFMLGLAAYYYIYHYHGGSRSMYTMRRLPDRWDLWRRCLTIPLVTILASALAAFLVMLVYFGIYMLFTPDECISPDQWRKIWDSGLIEYAW